MRIGIVIPNTPSYSETFFNAKIERLLAAGNEVILFSKNQGSYKKTKVIEPLNQNAFGFLRFILIALFNFSSLFKFYKLDSRIRKSKTRAFKNTYLNAHLLQKKLDWLHFGYATAAVGRELVAQCIGAKLAVSFRGYDINVYPLKNANCYFLLWEYVDKVHSVSKYLLDKAKTYGLPDNVDCEIIYDAADTSIINKFDTQPLMPDPTFTIVTIGRLNWIKGVQYAIQAIGEIKDDLGDFNYLIIGGGTKHEFEYMRFLIQEYGLEEQIILKGEQSHSDTIDLLRTADLYLQPSIGEGFCTAVTEAQALGKVCIVTDAGGLPENIVNNVTGYIVPKMNNKDLSSRILAFLSLSDSIRSKMSLEAKKRTQEYLSIENQIEKFIEFYKTQ